MRLTCSASPPPSPRIGSASGRPRRASPTGSAPPRSWRRSATRWRCWSSPARWRSRRSSASSIPEPVAAGPVMAVAAGAILVNGVSAWLLAPGQGGDLNLRAAVAHLMAECRRRRRRGGRGRADRADRLALGRSGAEPRHQRADRRRHLAPAARGGGDVARRRAARRARRRGARLPRRPAGRRRPARSPHLADEHQRDGADRAPRHARRSPPATPS